MVTEVEPHIRKTYRGDGDWLEERSRDFPGELDPYGEVPEEVESLKEEIAAYRLFFLSLRDGDEGWGIGVSTPEAPVDVWATHDESGRKALRIDISFLQEPEAPYEVYRAIVHRHYLYENNVGVAITLGESIFNRDPSGSYGPIKTITVRSQEFLNEIHLASLAYARKVCMDYKL